MNKKALRRYMVESAKTTATILAVLIGATAYAALLTSFAMSYDNPGAMLAVIFGGVFIPVFVAIFINGLINAAKEPEDETP